MTEQIKEIVLTAPIYLADTHGVYDLESTEAWIVPENTLIFETQLIGNLCSTTINNPLWFIAHLRNVFIQYFLVKKPVTKPDELAATFKNLIFYKPGDTIYTRNLSIDGGVGKRTTFSSMGFYKFDVDTPFHRIPYAGMPRPPSKILDELRTDLITNSTVVTNKDIVDILPPGPRIFIFSSCADSQDKYNDKFKEILAHQKSQMRALKKLKIYSGPQTNTNFTHRINKNTRKRPRSNRGTSNS